MVGNDMAINAAWHKTHVMPPRATPAQRLKWHEAHAKNCGCRPFTADMRAKLQQAVAAAGERKPTPTRAPARRGRRA